MHKIVGFFKILLFISVFILTTAIQADEQTLQKVKLQLQWKHQFEFAGFYAAKEKGFYKDAGVDVEFLEYTNNLDTTQKVIDGEVEYGLSYSDIIAEYLNNKPIVFVANFFKQSPLVLITQKNINSPKELKGKKVMGVSNSIDSITLRIMLNKFNVSMNDMQNIPANFNLDDFITKKVDAMSVFITNETYSLDKKNIKYNIFDPTLYGAKYYDVNLFTSMSEVKNNPLRVKRFKEASIKGWEYALKHQDEIVELILQKYNTQNKTREALLFEAKQIEQLMLPSVYSIGSIDKFRVQAIAETFIEAGFVNNIQKRDLKSFIFKDSSDNFRLDEKELAYLKEKKTITMCVDPKWMPFEKIEDGKYIGIGSSYIKLFSQKIETPIELIKTASWKESLEKAKIRECDILPMAVETASNKRYMNFTSAYLTSPIVIATKIGIPFIDSLEQVLDKKIAIVNSHAIYEKLKNRYPTIDFIKVNSTQEGLNRVYNDEVFAVIDSLIVVNSEIQKEYLNSIAISGKIDNVLKLGVASRNDEALLHDIFQKVVLSLDKEIKKKLINKWINIKYTKETDYKLVWYILITAFIIFIFFTFRYFFIKGIMQKEIDKKTKELQDINLTLEDKIAQRTDEQNQLLSLFNRGAVSLFKWKNDKNWSIEYVSNNVNSTFGYTKKEFLQSDTIYANIIHKDDLQRVQQEIKSALKNNLDFLTHAPYRIVIKNNSVIWVLDNTLLVKDSEGNCTHFLGYISNITTLINKEIETKLLKDRFQLAISGANDGLWDRNLLTEKVYFSTRFKEQIGYKEDEIGTDISEWVKRVHPDDIDNTVRDVKNYFSGKTELYENIHRLKHKNGSWIWVLSRAKALFDSDGKPIRLVGFHTDITRIKELEENLQELVDEKIAENFKQREILEQQSKLIAMREMIENIAHQWRQPLAQINAAVLSIDDALYDMKSENKTIQIKLDEVENLTTYMSSTIDDFKNFYNKDKEKSLFNLKNSIETVASLVKALLKSNMINLDIDIDEDAIINGFKNEFGQAILVILNNAKDALISSKTSNPKILIKLNTTDDLYLLSICDNAGGIKKEIINKIFEPYFTTKHKAQGTGLGLYFCKKIIEDSMDARLYAKNSNNGVCFIIEFKKITSHSLSNAMLLSIENPLHKRED